MGGPWTFIYFVQYWQAIRINSQQNERDYKENANATEAKREDRKPFYYPI